MCDGEVSSLRSACELATPGNVLLPVSRSVRRGPRSHPSYEGKCLQIGTGDYDCAGGTGNGPNFVNYQVRVVGPDEFSLDGDNDGIGCESG